MLQLIQDNVGKNKENRILSLYKCECGKLIQRPRSRVNKGSIVHCGCKTIENMSNSLKKHGNAGYKKSSEYIVWCAIKTRCININSKDYKRYGAIGITICKSWENSFEIFLSDMGKRPEGTTIDRIDNTKGYSPENCRWADSFMQQNNRNKTTFVIYKGEKRPIADVAREMGISTGCLHLRVKRGRLNNGIEYAK